MYRIHLLLAAALLFAGCSANEDPQTSSEAQSEGPVKLLYNAYLPPLDRVRAEVVEGFIERIEEESEGSISISVPGASLAQASDQWSLLNDNVADMAMVPIWSRRNTIQLPSLAELPLNSLSAESASVALWRTQQKYFDDLNEFDGYKVLFMYTLQPSHIITTKKPVRTEEDLDNLKLWGPPGGAKFVIQSFGATPVSSEYLQMYEYVSKGNVDGVMISSAAIKNAGIGTEVKYFTEIPGGLGNVSFAVIMSDDAWNRLNPEQQAAVERAAEDRARIVGKSLDETGDMVLRDFGLEMVEPAPELVAKIQKDLTAIRDSWIDKAKGAGLENAQEAFDYYVEQMHLVAAEAEAEDTDETPAE